MFDIVYITCMDIFYISTTLFKSSHRNFCMKEGVLKNFVKWTAKRLYLNLFFNKAAAEILFKKRPWRSLFSMNFAKFSGTPFLQNTFGRLLLFIFHLNSPKELKSLHSHVIFAQLAGVPYVSVSRP